MNILFTNVNSYLQTHRAFNIQMLNQWAREGGFLVYARLLDDVLSNKDRQHLDYTICSDSNWTDEQLGHHIQIVLEQVNPDRVVNNLEYFFPWQHVIRHTDAEKVYFVRNCVKRLLSMLDIWYHKTEDKELLPEIERNCSNLESERWFLEKADQVITDSPTSQQAILEEYGIIASLCLEYVNPKEFLQVPYATGLPSIGYNIGRADYHKGLRHMRAPRRLSIKHIGKTEVNPLASIPSWLEPLGLMPFPDYLPYISDCHFGIFPSLWESNGYAVQECLAMGRIPIVRQNSGGNERLIQHGTNGLIVDFDDDWERYLEQIDTQSMQTAARSTLTQDMFEMSYREFIRIMTK